MDDHISAVCKSAHYHIRAMRHICPAITEDMAKTVAIALVRARLDYANSVLFGMSSTNIASLQHVQNATTRVVVWGSRRRTTNSSTLLKQLHWLPIEWRMKFKIACLTYKTLATTQPDYLYSALKQYVACRSKRFSDSNLLLVPVSAHVLVLVVLLQLLPLSGIPFLWTFVVVLL